ncbi:MAG: NTPase [Candidatus Methanomethylicaceae archaeon]|nr:NTPase [Candidatus Verstraetearchaeota archaeon]
MKAIITGRPGIGKSTVLKEVIKLLKANGWRVGGIICPEVRVGAKRIAFEIVDLLTGERGTLASTTPSNGPMVGRYYVNIGDLDRISTSAISRSLDEADLTAIDEIGPMEMKSGAFRNITMKALMSDKKLIAVVHIGLVRNIVSNFQNMRVFEVTEHNRNRLPGEIVKHFIEGSL